MPRMRIAVDARSLCGERTGVGRTLEGLYGAFTRLFPGDSVVLLSPRPIALPAALEGQVEVRPPGRPRLPGTIWLQTVAAVEAVRAGADLFHGPLGILPLACSPSGGRDHPRPDPPPLPRVARPQERRRVRPAPPRHREAGRPPRLRFPGDAGRPPPGLPGGGRQGVRRPERPRPRARDGRSGRLPSRPYVLSIGTLEPRKNHERLVAAMESIWDRRPDFPDLVLVGGTGWGMPGFDERLSRSRHAARIARLGWVPSERAAALLAGRPAPRLPEPLRGIRPPRPRGDGRGDPRRRVLLLVASGGGRRRGPPPRPSRPGRDRLGDRAGERRRGVPRGGPAGAARSGRGSSPGRPPRDATRALFAEAAA